MMAPGHQVVGFTFGVGALTLIPAFEVVSERPFQMVLFLVFVLIGSLLPDIDTPTSTFGQKFWRGLLTIFTLAFLCYLFFPSYLNTYRDELKIFVMMLLPVLIMIRGHRKMTHSLLFVGLLIVYSAILEQAFQVPRVLAAGLVVGVISHLFGDYLTKKGIPLFYPFSKKHQQFLITFRTGSPSEKMIVYSLVLWNVWFLTSTIF
ncbi:metal-dependent hydrolase [Halobacillus kuroshimensis]|uniref:Metal-dependent hydrolase n=2 Tax=Halobacillus kuroshimensis TaxID=302481 RepID=A0ABS3E0I2_9BACI|nr:MULTISPECIES: metal-dependent hydrolase [Halobacillus]MBN8237064.1 metal-dependent hydrolase [Halobacillus kuroshimensis]